jgi:hypothetical protein
MTSAARIPVLASSSTIAVFRNGQNVSTSAAQTMSRSTSSDDKQAGNVAWRHRRIRGNVSSIPACTKPLTARKRNIARSATSGEFDGRRFVDASSRRTYPRRSSTDSSRHSGGLSPHHPSRKRWTNRPYFLRVLFAKPFTVPRYASNSLSYWAAVVPVGTRATVKPLSSSRSDWVIIFSSRPPRPNRQILREKYD